MRVLIGAFATIVSDLSLIFPLSLSLSSLRHGVCVGFIELRLSEDNDSKTIRHLQLTLEGWGEVKWKALTCNYYMELSGYRFYCTLSLSAHIQTHLL